MNKDLFNFDVAIYGNFEKYNEVLSKARLRIFYKYENRNGTFITDEFADKLLSSVSYAPVKGIYENNDYTDHGTDRNEGRIYGIVPENPNLAWEDHLDNDGVTRTYACVDVLIFTALYEEANSIIGKSQSMELYAPSIKYHEAIIKNRRFIVFDDGCFLGLQVLGEGVEPCFEGASFYTLQSTIEYAIKKIKEHGGTKMPKLNFKISDDQKFSALWSLLNNEYNEEGGWIITYGISAVYDDYALVVSYETGEMYRAYYSKNDEQDMIELGEMVHVFVIDVTENEKNTIDTLRTINGGTYDLVNENLINADENAEKIIEFSTKIDELTENVATLTTEIENYNTSVEEANNTITSLNEEINSLKEYKLDIETQQKNAVINEYIEHLSEDILNDYRNKISEYSVEELDMRLAYELKKNNTSIFNKKDESGFIPKDTPADGIAAILSKYKK